MTAPYSLDSFDSMLAKTKEGVCCLAGCEGRTELESGGGFMNSPPILCQKHLDDPTPTHLGQWVSRNRGEVWNCCEQNYKMTICSKLRDAFTPYGREIPITAEQIGTRDAVITARREAFEYWERLNNARNAGCDEYYDR